MNDAHITLWDVLAKAGNPSAIFFAVLSALLACVGLIHLFLRLRERQTWFHVRRNFGLEYYFLILEGLVLYSRFVVEARWQFSAECANDRERQGRINVGAALLLLNPREISVFEKVIAAIDDVERFYAAYCNMLAPASHACSWAIRQELLALKAICLSLDSVLKTGDTWRPSDIRFDAAAMRGAIEKMLRRNYFSSREVKHLLKFMVYHEKAEQHRCCPAPLDLYKNEVTRHLICPEDISSVQDNRVISSVLETLYIEPGDRAPLARSRDWSGHPQLAEQIKAIAWCHPFLDVPDGPAATDDRGGATAGSHAYLCEYGRRYIRELTAFCLAGGLISERTAETWLEVAQAQDLKIEALFDVGRGVVTGAYDNEIPARDFARLPSLYKVVDRIRIF